MENERKIQHLLQDKFELGKKLVGSVNHGQHSKKPQNIVQTKGRNYEQNAEATTEIAGKRLH